MQNNANYPQVAVILAQLTEAAKQGKSPDDCDEIGTPLDPLTADWSINDRLELSLEIAKIFGATEEQTQFVKEMAQIELSRANMLRAIGMPNDRALKFARDTMG